MKTYPFNTAFTQLRELYGITINSDEFETIGLIAWSRIGNKRFRWYKFNTPVSLTEKGEPYIDLPCNCDILEAVTANYEDYQKTSNDKLSEQSGNPWAEDYIESRKYNTSSFYVSGKYIKYKQDNNRLWLSDSFSQVNVLYKGVLADEDGLPFLNEKELDAVSVFVAYSKTFKDALVSRDANTMQFAQMLEAKWKNLCTQARVPDYLNQNEMDEILNVSTSWDRKRFGKSFKPIR